MKTLIKVGIILAIFGWADKKHGYTQSMTGKAFKIFWYNTENLFDTINDVSGGDDDFTPDGKLKWNSQRYFKKLSSLAEVISLASYDGFPAVIGLCEVENKNVLDDLVKQDLIKNAGYAVIHHNSPDERGIDAALLYRPEIITCMNEKTIQVTLDTSDRTRDIVYFKGKLPNSSLIHIFANHWPSRRGGDVASEWKRIKAASILRKAVDSVLQAEKNASVFIMGDFNDEPGNKSIREVLLANNDSNSYHFLYNLMWEDFNNGSGTHYYMNDWSMLDQMIVSQPLRDEKSKIRIKDHKATIFKPETILYLDKKNNMYCPSRTYAGDRYTGGYSDHLPVFIDLIYE